MFYGPEIFDPWLILAQIGVMQCSFYIIVGLWLTLFSVVFGIQPSLDSLLSAKQLCAHFTEGWASIFAFICVFPPCAFAMVLIVRRAKKCLDFASTVYIFHFFFCWAFDGIPTNWEWWLVNSSSLIGLVVLAEFLCLRREMRDIPRSETELMRTDKQAIV